MKNFLTVLKFELMHFLKNKGFLISTIIICILIAIGLSIPSIRGVFTSSNEDSLDNADKELISYGYINSNNTLHNTEFLESNFPLGNLKKYSSKEDLEKGIMSGDLEAGFILESPSQYEYIVQNNELIDMNQSIFHESFSKAVQIQGFEELGIEYEDISQLLSPIIQYETIILGTDSAGNYLYTYILVFILYFMIIMYGQLIATSVASEKSNRAMEVLITSTDSTNLIFGKVLGGAIAGIIQVGLVLLTAKIFYTLNANAWDNMLDFIFEIPIDVILLFSVFGILGYLFYSFIFGALGALVSRTEDVSTSSTPVTITFVVVFIIAMSGMYNTEGLIMTITSYLPISSFLSMFVRVSMGTVSTIEVLISLAILIISTVITGVIASKIYRMGTLMYGNPVKIKTAIKLLRRQK
ncbi:ABC transporter permease [Alkalibaculum sp. M08DMB]|uniref:ABC transporter permease n=1 Tax=Alkalibaculum sporogenes TaxID=2655001 RepID=A0A6A7K539_9FIRM|nr:ABC transporter permease [Alkalibaculum sporogenes]MPW24576.1 ABC transporter permease [Alkalibaculum sporogenes]